MDSKKEEKKFRKFEIVTYNSHPKVITANVKYIPNYEERPYSGLIEEINSYDEDFYVEKVEKVFIEYVEGELLMTHWQMCYDVAHEFNVLVEFVVDGTTIQVSDQTPDDWYDLCMEDAVCLRDKSKPFGPFYIKLDTDVAKELIYVNGRAIDELNQEILAKIMDKNVIFGQSWRNDFKTYNEYRNWAINKYNLIFIRQRRVNHYYNILRAAGEHLTQKDIEEISSLYGETADEMPTNNNKPQEFKPKRRTRKNRPDKK